MTGRPFRPRPAAISAAGRGPVVRPVIRLRLPVRHHFVDLPSPTSEHGGVLPYPPGTLLHLDIGDARHCDLWTAVLLAGAVRDCAEIEIAGTDPAGVTETRAALTRALTTGAAPAC